MADEDYIAWEMLYGSSAPSEDWRPPDWWIPVPEPGDYEIYFLIQTYTDNYGNGKKFEYMLGQEITGDVGQGHVHCDWGDGTEDDFYPYMNYGAFGHTYAEDGQYLIHITADENTTLCRGSDRNQARWLIFKSGAKMTFFCDYFEKHGYGSISTFTGKGAKYIKINHPKGVPLDKKNDFFSVSQSLQKLEMNQIKPENIANYTFSNCYALKKLPIDFDKILSVGANAFYSCGSLNKLHMENCLTIGNSAFQRIFTNLESVFLPNCTSIDSYAFGSCYCLRSVYAPNCTSVGNGAFQYCYNLQSVTFADGCAFGTNCFQNCYSLYSRPDGSVN